MCNRLPGAYAAAYPDCPIVLGDVNGDTYVNFDDISDFSALLAGTQLPGQKYVYDEENRLVAVTTIDDEPLLEIRYDALGRRVLTTDHVGAGDPCSTNLPRWTRHVYSGIQVVAEYEACGLSGGGPATSWVLAREFIWGDRFPEPVAMVDWTDAGDVPAGTAEVLHYLHDPLGSVVGLTDAGDPGAVPPVPGKLVERYTYEPYGRTFVEHWDASAGGGSGAWVRSASGASRIGNPFAWTGQRFDAGVRLYHFLFRSYSPELGRWMQRDPAGYVDGASLYEYVKSCATLLIDPEGLDACDKLRSELQSLTAQAANIGTALAAQKVELNHEKETVANIFRQLAEREIALHRNPLNLRESEPGDGKRPSLSRDGHRKIMADLYKALRHREKNIARLNALIERTDRELKDMNEKIAKAAAALAACEKAEKEAKERLGKKLLKRGAKAAAGKLPLIAGGFFVYDWCTGGFGHAVNELTWPVSEAWD